MFSVVIPVYNSQETILAAIQSVEKQTNTDLVEEILVVDDGSTDATAERVRSHAVDSPLSIQLLTQPNKGPAAARNLGMRRAKGEYIAFLDADDTWEADKLARQAEALKKNPKVDLLCGGREEGPLRILWRQHPGLYHATLRDYCIKSFILTSTVVIRKERLKQTGYFNEKMHHCEDMNLYQRFFRWNEVYYLEGRCMRFDPAGKHEKVASLSDDFYKMHRSRKYNYYVLYKDRMISRSFFVCMLLFGEMKYLRRRLLGRWKE